MIEMHTKLTCDCGRSFYAMYADGRAVPKTLERTVTCPFCGKELEYKYEFDADFSHNKWWKFWDKKHYIADHSSFNEGSFDEEIYPRKCVCGKEVLLKQKRIK